ncbi:MAG: phosphoglycerate mutase family protein, partial [Clostridia bacterium]|nr:phosphoglycerate mutase family protein [Clostridia bacterium]
MKTFKIHIIRHGLSEGSNEGKYIGHTDAPLTEEGRKQLENMKRDYEYPKVSAVLSSPMNRCLET